MNQSNKDLWTKYESHALNEGLSQKRINKLSYMYLTILRGLEEKTLSKVTREEIESFVNKLNRNEFKKINKGDYTGTSKSDIKKFIKYFWKWFKGNEERYPPEVSWIKTKISKDEKPEQKDIISIAEVQRLASHSPNLEYKAIILMLFDSGFRIDEFLSITKKDLTWEEYDNTQKCFWVKCNRSKTVIRKVPIPLFTEDIKNFVNSVTFAELKDNDIIFNKEYDAIRMYLKKLSLKVLNKELTPHNFRHSSATYYAKALDGDMISICQRYGWSLSSNEAKTYIRLSGAYEKQTAKKVFQNDTIKLQEQVTDMSKEMERLKKENEIQLRAIYKLLKENKITA